VHEHKYRAHSNARKENMEVKTCKEEDEEEEDEKEKEEKGSLSASFLDAGVSHFAQPHAISLSVNSVLMDVLQLLKQHWWNEDVGEQEEKDKTITGRILNSFHSTRAGRPNLGGGFFPSHLVVSLATKKRR
jgi:hypothetical protein